MDLITDIDNDRKKIQASIRKYGFKPEHSYYYYKDEETPSKKNIFVSFGRGSGILAQKTKTSWHIVSDVLAPKKQQIGILLDFLEFAFKKKAIKTVEVEFDEEFRTRLFSNPFFRKTYKTKHSRTLWWPVFDMKKWDGHKLAGKKWKKLRNMKNRLLKNHKIEFKPPKVFNKTQLRKVVREWASGRVGNDEAHPTSYYNNIRNNFKGFDYVNVMVVDGKPCAITGGWKIVNSKNYYSCLGLLNYKYRGIGEVSNLQDLILLKKQNFRFVDFGGSDQPLLEFKKKFRPHKIYKTHQFFIYRRN
jgi:hypothetical protein